MTEKKTSSHPADPLKPYKGRFESYDRLPVEGRDKDDILQELSAMAEEENARWQTGRVSGTFYHAGDTSLFSDMTLIAELWRPHLAFLPIGDHFTMDPYQAALACRFLEVREVVPIHWGTFPLLTGTPAQLEQELAALGVNCEVVTLQPGEKY